MTDDERKRLMYIMSAIIPGSLVTMSRVIERRERQQSEMFIKMIEHRLDMLTENDIENMI